MKDYLDTIRGSTEEIEYSAHALNGLAKAFYITGNEIVSEELYRISESILVSKKNINDAVRRKSHSQFEEAQESFANLFQNILTVKD